MSPGRKKDAQGQDRLFVTVQFKIFGRDGRLADDVLPTEIQVREGGQAIDSGPDVNGDGVLESNEVTSIAYVCTQPGESALVRVDPEPPGANCSAARSV